MPSKKYLPLEMPPVSKHLWRSPGWMSTQKYHEYQKKRVEAARIEHDKVNQAEERHNAFLENAKKHGIQIRKKKK